jgi:hypothetical protein|tara:strand:+ start:377 stop:928 length:552 start_codon:yes stop_codon:yes gene_type:complete
MKHILFLLLILIGCSKETTAPDPEPQVSVDIEPEAIVPDFENDTIYMKVKPKVLGSYWTAFKESASLYDVDLSNIEEVTFVSENLLNNIAGTAKGSCQPYVRISVDETTFRNLSVGEQIFLMYHELGHDVFNASHDGGGLMSPNIRTLEYKLFQTEVKDFFTGEDYIEWTDEECEYIRSVIDD